MASDEVPNPLDADDPSRGPRPGDLPLDALLGAQRESLPPLRLSMHVYADDPMRRFAIVDGQRLREGDALATGLQVLAIQRDGLRLAWNDRVLWVPR
jgi:general secretion pathway protein B